MIPNHVQIILGNGGLPKVVVTAKFSTAEIYLHGAHVTAFQKNGEPPLLFLSRKSIFVPDKAIRGGVPIIFPWFGPRSDGKPGPAHGFARTSEWAVEGTKLRNDGNVQITLALAPNETTRGLGYASFHLRFRVTIGSELEMELETRNEASEPLPYEGTTFIDKTDGFKRKKLGNEPMQIAKETDQVHLTTQATCVIHDPVWPRRIIIGKSGSDSTVVWNPWIDKTKGMSDMAPDDWQGMLCVETSNAADNAVHLPPGAYHRLTASIGVE